MAPESERANPLESICTHCRQTIHNVGKFGAPGKPDMWLHEDGAAYCKNTTATPANPNEPLTCSEVVERLAECFYYHQVAFGTKFREYLPFDRQLATAILHSWRERRVQELEECLREISELRFDSGGTLSAAGELAEKVLAKSEWREQIRKGAKHD